VATVNEQRGLGDLASDRAFFGHPRGLATLFFSEMWERFSYYGMRAFLLLYMAADVATGGMGLDSATAAVIYGVYTSSVYLANIPGGWLADRVFGQRKAVP
jgi:POT family proton-dependent oligopeptide transporter